MLKTLTIKNYALIKDLNISFENGFATITGETGAGKSILLGALSLILGERADSATLLDKSSKCIVEGKFYIAELYLQDFFNRHDLDYDDETIIRREISTSGKSRAFINDTPVNLNVLKEIGNQLVDIHSQNNNRIINDFQYQLQVVDTIADHKPLLDQYKSLFNHHKQLIKELDELKTTARESKAELDYLQFQFDQLNEAKLEAHEQEDLERELEVLNHAEEIKMALSDAFNLLSEQPDDLNGKLADMLSQIEKISTYYKQGEEFAKRIDSVLIELKDLASEIEIAGNDVEFNPERFELIKERLDLIYSLQQKHQVKSVSQLLQIQDELDHKINTIGSYDEEINKLEKQEHQYREQLIEQAANISENRAKAIPGIEKNLLNVLQKLGMPDASLVVKLTKSDELKNNGQDEVRFLFTANSKVEGRDIAKVASGGELSRVMLAVKALVSAFKTLPTIIFDEIDAGVSGDIGHKMGEIMHTMAQNMQVISITHLAQIASKGNIHYCVYKDVNEELPATRMKLLNTEERITEIAKMLSGEKLTQASIENAKELLN